MGVILWPLAVCGDICEGRRLNGCSSSSVRSCGAAAEMSAPESGRTDVTVDPFTVVMFTLIVGAECILVTCLRVDRWLGVCSVDLFGIPWRNAQLCYNSGRSCHRLDTVLVCLHAA